MIRSPSAEADVIGMDGNLDDSLLPVLKHSVSLLDILQTIPVSNQRRRVDQPLFNQRENLGTVAAVHTAGLEGQVLAVHVRERQYLRTVIESDYGDYCIRAG